MYVNTCAQLYYCSSLLLFTEEVGTTTNNEDRKQGCS